MPFYWTHIFIQPLNSLFDVGFLVCSFPNWSQKWVVIHLTLDLNLPQKFMLLLFKVYFVDFLVELALILKKII